MPRSQPGDSAGTYLLCSVHMLFTYLLCSVHMLAGRRSICDPRMNIYYYCNATKPARRLRGHLPPLLSAHAFHLPPLLSAHAFHLPPLLSAHAGMLFTYLLCSVHMLACLEALGGSGSCFNLFGGSWRLWVMLQLVWRLLKNLENCAPA